MMSIILIVAAVFLSFFVVVVVIEEVLVTSSSGRRRNNCTVGRHRSRSSRSGRLAATPFLLILNYKASPTTCLTIHNTPPPTPRKTLFENP